MDRLEYIQSLAEEQSGGGPDRFHALLMGRLETTLDEFLGAAA